MLLTDTLSLTAKVKFAQANDVAGCLTCIHNALFLSIHVLIHDIQDDGYSFQDIIHSASHEWPFWT